MTHNMNCSDKDIQFKSLFTRTEMSLFGLLLIYVSKSKEIL